MRPCRRGRSCRVGPLRIWLPESRCTPVGLLPIGGRGVGRLRLGEGRLGWWRAGREAKAREDGGRGLRRMEGRQDPHRTAAAGAFEHVDREDAPHEFRPGEATRARESGGGGWRGNDASRGSTRRWGSSSSQEPRPRRKATRCRPGGWRSASRRRRSRRFPRTRRRSSASRPSRRWRGRARSPPRTSWGRPGAASSRARQGDSSDRSLRGFGACSAQESPNGCAPHGSGTEGTAAHVVGAAASKAEAANVCARQDPLLAALPSAYATERTA